MLFQLCNAILMTFYRVLMPDVITLLHIIALLRDDLLIGQRSGNFCHNQ